MAKLPPPHKMYLKVMDVMIDYSIPGYRIVISDLSGRVGVQSVHRSQAEPWKHVLGVPFALDIRYENALVDPRRDPSGPLFAGPPAHPLHE